MVRATAKRDRGAEDKRPGVWKAYGKVLKLLREHAGLTQDQLADLVGYSHEQVASIEQGRRPAKHEFTVAAEQALDARGVLDTMQEDVDLARLPAFFQDFAQIEGDAISFFWYGNHVMPGLLQTEAYARALLACNCPGLDDDQVEQRIEARLARQAILTRKPTVELSFIIGESVLTCPVGGRDVLREQLHQLLKLGALPNVSVQIMPNSYGNHVGLNGPVVMLETADRRRVAYFESQDQSMIVTDPVRVSTLALRCGKLRTQALNEVESARLIERLAGEL
ncbi:helix-turn-helix domain-containing protein [Yinghuangia sp. YIM S09857]|uniref:helix-turn-helix domain-containing protein n=1 Tax=Yinghuangia sp. YIM S09857 TaxID=3436929 RepID=UPI003F53BF68